MRTTAKRLYCHSPAREQRIAPSTTPRFGAEPDEVDVLTSGTLAISGGPVYDPNGKLIARFSSIWRLEAPGTWRVVFDRGTDVCDCRKAAP